MKPRYIALLVVLLCPMLVQAQDNWQYKREIRFPVSGADTVKVRPYLATVADDGTLYVISSRANDTLAHNALWKAAPGATQFTLVEDFTAKGEVAVYSTRGITAMGNDVLLTALPNPRNSQVGATYYYTNGDAAQRRVFSGANGNAGYGTFPYGIDATDQGFVFAALSFQTSMRVYNFSNPSASNYGNWVAMTPSNNTEVGGHDVCGISALRDITVVPGLNYNTDTSAPFYTSRNASPQTEQCTAYGGGVSVWVGGTTADPISYRSQRVSDPQGFLSLSTFVPSGITADPQQRLWVSGPDTLRRWVKAFDVFGSFATEALELPSATSASNPVAGGAPFRSPNDVALNRAGSIAYVIDFSARRAFVFQDDDAVGIAPEEVPGLMRLEPNVPNPVRGSTTFTYHLDRPGNVRLAVFDVLGREVVRLAEGVQAEGAHQNVLDVAALPSGLYVIRLEAHGHQLTRAFSVMK